MAARFSGARDGSGTMPAEWPAAGQGMGYGMLRDVNTFNSADIWAPAAPPAGAPVPPYTMITILESAVPARFSPRDADA